MFWFILGIIATLVAAYFLGLEKYEETVKGRYSDINVTKTRFRFRLRQLYALFGLLICIVGFMASVPANSVGILYSPFGGTREETLTEGFHSKNPFDKVYNISTEIQTTRIENLTTQTKDAQYLTSNLDIKYYVNTQNAYLIFKQYRTLDRMSSTLITPTTQRILELITTKYNVIDILGEERSQVYAELEKNMTEELAKYGINFHSIAIIDMDAGEALEKAITDEAVAKKAVETAEQKLMEAEINAKQQSVQAQAEQDAAKIKSETKLIEAEADKKANELLNQSLTDEILQKEWINKWDGKMPTYYSGSPDGLGIMISSN